MPVPTLKQPADERDFPLDFADALSAGVAEVVSVAIAARGQVAEATPLSCAATAIAGSTVTLTLAGGTAGELYVVTVTAVTAGAAETAEKELELLVEDLAWTVPDGSSAYLSIEDFVTRLGIAATIQLTDEAGSGRIGKTPLIAALLDAQAEVDSYLGKLYPVPLAAPVPQRVARLVFALAVAALYTGALPAAVEQARDRATRALRDLASGAAVLTDIAAPTPVPAPTAPIALTSAPRRFTRQSMRDF